MKIIPKGTKIHVCLHTGYIGMDAHDFYELETDFTEDQLNNIITEMAYDHASSYGVECEDSYISEEEREEAEDNGVMLSSNIEGYFEIYIPEEHDKYSVSGTPVFDKF